MFRSSRYHLHLPRYFTGGLFPEAVAEKLIAAESALAVGGAARSIWVSRRLLANGTFGNSVTLLPNARIVDAAALAPAEVPKLIELLGPDTVLVHASHTSSPDWFAQHLKHLGEAHFVPEPGDGAVNEDTSIASPSPPSFPYIPFTVTGGVFRAKLSNHLTSVAAPTVGKGSTERVPMSPWWIPESWVNRRNTLWPLITPDDAPAGQIDGNGWFNVSQTTIAGSCCARSAAMRCYEPYTIYGGQFPRNLELRMQKAALRHGWNKRLWLTLPEAAKLAGVVLKAGEVSDCMTTIMSRDGCFPSVYFCGSQFHDPDNNLPQLRQLHLIGTGALRSPRHQQLLDPMWQSGRPSTHQRTAEAWAHDVDAIARGTAPQAGSAWETERVGSIAQKPLHLHSALRLHRASQYLTLHDVKQSTAFIPLKPGAQGRCVHGRHVAMKEVTYFNAEEFEFPALATAMGGQQPVHLLSYNKFFGPLQTKMLEHMATAAARSQVATTTSHVPTTTQSVQQSKFWVPVDFLRNHGFTVPDLAQTFHVDHAPDVGFLLNRPWQGKLGNTSNFGTMEARSFVYLPEVPDPTGRLSQIARYLPRRVDGRCFTGLARALIIDHAIQHNLLLRDPRWVSSGILLAAGVDAAALASCDIESGPKRSYHASGGEGEEQVPQGERALDAEDTTGIIEVATGRSSFFPLCVLPQEAQETVMRLVNSSIQAPAQTKFNKMTVPRHSRDATFTMSTATTSDARSGEGMAESTVEFHDLMNSIVQTPCDASVL